MAKRVQYYDGKAWVSSGPNVKSATTQEKSVKVVPDYKFLMAGFPSNPTPSVEKNVFYGGLYTLTHTTGTSDFLLTPTDSPQPAETVSATETAVSILNFTALGISLNFGINGIDLSAMTTATIQATSTGSVRAIFYDDPIIPGKGAVTIPVGTIAERPANPKVGMMRVTIDASDYTLFFGGFPTNPNNADAVVNPTLLSDNLFYGGRYTLEKTATDTFKLTPPTESKQKFQSVTATETTVTDLNFDTLGIHLYWAASTDLSTLSTAYVDTMAIFGAKTKEESKTKARRY